MTTLHLFVGDSAQDDAVKHFLETWIKHKTDLALEYLSVHSHPAQIVRLGITDLPALVFQDEILAQGALENWLILLLDRVFANSRLA